MSLLSRRAFVQRGMFAASALTGGALVTRRATGQTELETAQGEPAGSGHGTAHDNHMIQSTVGAVGPDAIGIDPMTYLTTFDYGKASRLPDGRTLREWDILAFDREIEVAPGVFFLAWTYNGQVPGPTLRCTEGDLLRIRFKNAGTHPHTIHFHGFHPAFHDGVPGSGPGGHVLTGQEFTYEFEASPFGLHIYHCHSFPLAAHIAKGLYGTFIVDPKQPRADADEMVMVMNAFDTNFDGGNEVYAVNTVGFAYFQKPIQVRRGQLIRIYLSNLVEFDPVNSMHVHANFFDYFPTGTSLKPTEFTDTIMQCQGQRGILEMRFPHTGQFMFHAHQSEFAQLGWMGLFDVS